MNSDPSESDADKESSQVPFQGIFIIENMGISIPEGGLKLEMGEGGIIKNASITIHVLIDMSFYWLKIAWEHLKVAELSNENLKLAVLAKNDEDTKTALEAEFSASIQVFTSLAFSLDAFDKMVRERIVLPKGLEDSWKSKDLAWQKQVTEVLKLGFQIRGKYVDALAQMLASVAKFRNDAVHPPVTLSPALYHHELGLSTEWRFVRYTFANAKIGLDAVLGLYAQLPPLHKKKFKPLHEYCLTLERVIQPIVVEWEAKYGPLSYKKGK